MAVPTTHPIRAIMNIRRDLGLTVLSQILILLCLLISSSAFGQTISVNANVAGVTPRVIGLNSGNYLPGSNTTTWWKWTGVNGARIFTSAPRIEPVDDAPPFGDGVIDSGSFLTRRLLLRLDPTNSMFNNFSAFEDQYANNDSDFINYLFAYDELSSNGIQPLALINRTNSQYPFDDEFSSQGWRDRWEHWQHYYAQAFYLGSNFGVERYSVYNEPDASSQDVTQADYLLRLQLASDAIQGALEDVNQMFGMQLEPQISAPITAGASIEYMARLTNIDTRDDEMGWGELVINNLHMNFLGEFDPAFQLVHTYAYQEYNHDGPRYSMELAALKQFVTEDAPNEQIGFGLTEFNVHSNGVFEDLPETLETPSKYSRLGAIFTSLTNGQANELFLFKMSSNAEDSFLQKNAVFHNSRFDAPYNTGGASAAAGVLKLFTTGFVDEQILFAEPNQNVNDLYMAASYNPEEDCYYLLSASESTQTRNLQINLSAWGIESGVIAHVEEVAQGHLAEITARIAVPANQTIAVTQAPESVLLISVPATQPDNQLFLSPTDDAMVKAANNGNSNFGTSDNLTVKNVADGPNGRNVSFVKFDTSMIGSSTIERATLQLRGENLGTDEFAIAHVYVIENDEWTESTITFNNAPNLADTVGEANLITHNFVEGIGDTAEFAGHLTVDEEFRLISLDVTDYLRAHPDDEISFLLIREVRIDGENVDETVSHLRFASKERSGNVGPRLLVDLTDAEFLLGDVNCDGVVNLLDVDPFVNALSNGIFDPKADINMDGSVNLLDVTPFIGILSN